MTTITLEKAQQNLPDLVKRALGGEGIVIEASEKAAVQLAPVTLPSAVVKAQAESYRGRDALKGQLVVGPEFFEPLPDDECGFGNDNKNSA
jgi:antitoxin (DNA-binding transcriptional repressor) of toxin-antitoxin stability system